MTHYLCNYEENTQELRQNSLKMGALTQNSQLEKYIHFPI